MKKSMFKHKDAVESLEIGPDDSLTAPKRMCATQWPSVQDISSPHSQTPYTTSSRMHIGTVKRFKSDEKPAVGLVLSREC